MNCQKHILLTGAGFTKNFGGPLAKEMWGIIFSNPILDKAPRVRDILRRDFDFESAYNSIIRGRTFDDLTNDGQTSRETEREALRKAVDDAYEYIDEKVRGFSFRNDSPYPVNIYKVEELISKFAGTVKNPGFFFTLNQDLFIERRYQNGMTPNLPGVPYTSTQFINSGKAARCVIPASIDLNFKGSPFFYLKLHGSSNWYAGDKQTMVIGHSKKEQVATEPILTGYFDAFRSVLTSGDRRLLCIGYSFSDPHVNEVIYEGVVKSGLRVYVLSPEAPNYLRDRLTGERGEIIWKGLGGYFQADLKTLFPADQTVTAEWKLLQKQFFSNEYQ